jgi:hypothetical protein
VRAVRLTIDPDETSNNALPFLIQGGIRKRAMRLTVPVCGVILIALAPVEVGVHPCGGPIVDVLNNLMSGVPITVLLTPKRLKIRRALNWWARIVETGQELF